MAFDPMVLAKLMMPLSDDDKLVALAWLDKAATDGDDIQRGLLAALLEGMMALGVVNGEVKFRLTEAGRAWVDGWIKQPQTVTTYSVDCWLRSLKA